MRPTGLVVVQMRTLSLQIAEFACVWHRMCHLLQGFIGILDVLQHDTSTGMHGFGRVRQLPSVMIFTLPTTASGAGAIPPSVHATTCISQRLLVARAIILTLLHPKVLEGSGNQNFIINMKLEDGMANDVKRA